MEILMFVSTALLIYELVYYLHIKRTIATWDEERFTHKGKISLKDVIRRYQSVLRYVKPKPITIFLFVVIFLNVYLALTDPVMREYSIEFIVLLAPLPAVVYLIREIFSMMLERAEELSRK